MPRCDSDSRAERLLKLAVAMDWLSAGENPSGLPARDDALFLPAEWGVPADVPFRRYRDEMELPEAFRTGGNGGLLIRNGRYASKRAGILPRRLPEGADVVAVTVAREQSEYRERLHTTGDGRVMGFRRLYRDGVAPAAVPADWPHAVFVTSHGLATLDQGSIPASFTQLIERASSAGLVTAALEVGGDAWDLGSDQGLLAFYCGRLAGRAPRTRYEGAPIPAGGGLFGDVLLGGGANISESAVIIGPAFVADGASVGANALVRASIAGPGAVIGEGAVISNRVILEGDGAVNTPAAPSRSIRARWDGQERSYRQWPLISYARLGKRAFDILFSLCAFVILATIFPLVALAIKLNSKGPVFYGHTRQGLHGRIFRCLKFRTMVQNAEAAQEELRAVNEVDGPQFKMEDDPRVTIVGAFLRATNLDEIPQFINVLKGDMSIVGPRPSPDAENQMCPWWREARLSVRPGITGLWQVERSRSRDNDFQEWIYYDVQYVRSLSFGRDIIIIFKTFGVLGSAFAKLFVTRTEAQTEK